MATPSTPVRFRPPLRLACVFALVLTGLPGPWLRSARAAPPARTPTPTRVYADDPGVNLAITKVLHEARSGVPLEPKPGPHGARLKFLYRMFEFRCADGPCWYYGVGMVAYPSGWIDMKGGWRALRFGIGLQGAGENKQQRDSWWQHNFMLEALLVVGLQYPWRLTPYAEFIVGLGAMHRNLYNKDNIDFAYSFGVEAGLEWFAYGRFNMSAAVGWRRSIVDTGEISLFADSVTFHVGFGF